MTPIADRRRASLLFGSCATTLSIVKIDSIYGINASATVHLAYVFIRYRPTYVCSSLQE